LTEEQKRQRRVNLAGAATHALERAKRENWPTAIFFEPDGVTVYVRLVLERMPPGTEVLAIVHPKDENVSFYVPEDRL
jgi:hypothetical protein